jgi:hypothetical protein
MRAQLEAILSYGGRFEEMNQHEKLGAFHEIETTEKRARRHTRAGHQRVLKVPK